MTADPATPPATADTEPEVRVARPGAIGHLTLNRPRALNALTLAMCDSVDHALAAWADDPAVHAVVIEGAGGKAFCAGGDVIAVWRAGRARFLSQDTTETLTIDFFRSEYRMNHRIGTFPKPYVALLDGITMGGGAGISAHGSHRVVTEKTLWAMPENNIGLFPDVGLIHKLVRCPGQTGTWAAMTGARLKAADLMAMGLATHHVASGAMPEVRRGLMQGGDPDRVLADHADPAEGVALSVQYRDVIDHCFDSDHVETILERLAAHDSPFARGQLEILRQQSPTSMKLTLDHLRRSRDLDLAAVLEMDFRMVQTVMAGHDFYEGIRALLIDKDRQPRWRPATLEEVTPQEIARYRQPVAEGSLGLADL